MWECSFHHFELVFDEKHSFIVAGYATLIGPITTASVLENKTIKNKWKTFENLSACSVRF